MAGIINSKRGSSPAEDIAASLAPGGEDGDEPAMGGREMKVSMAQDLITAIQAGDAEGVVDALEALILEIEGGGEDVDGLDDII